MSSKDVQHKFTYICTLYRNKDVQCKFAYNTRVQMYDVTLHKYVQKYRCTV